MIQIQIVGLLKLEILIPQASMLDGSGKQRSISIKERSIVNSTGRGTVNQPPMIDPY